MRGPDPMLECRPGGSCPDCNPKPVYCQRCLERTVENADDLCEQCEAEQPRADYCPENEDHKHRDSGGMFFFSCQDCGWRDDDNFGDHSADYPRLTP